MQEFRKKVRGGVPQLGVFIKTPSHQMPEILGRAGLDFAVIDCEHGAFNPETLDRMALAARSAGLPCHTRIPENAPAPILQALDIGLSGVLVPHVKDANAASAALAAAKYSLGRGFASSTRAGNYGGVDALAYRKQADLTTTIWCQIEDEAALGALDQIAAVEEVDCLFLGRADLALSLKVDSQSDPKVVEAVKATAAAGRRHGRTVGIFIASTSEIPDLLALGITVFACGSDHSLLLAHTRALAKDFSAILAARR